MARRSSRSVQDRGGFDLDQMLGGVQRRTLERNGLVQRTVHPTVPPRVEYTLTEAGRGLRATADGMCEWTYRYFQHGVRSGPGRASTRCGTGDVGTRT